MFNIPEFLVKQKEKLKDSLQEQQEAYTEDMIESFTAQDEIELQKGIEKVGNINIPETLVKQKERKKEYLEFLKSKYKEETQEPKKLEKPKEIEKESNEIPPHIIIPEYLERKKQELKINQNSKSVFTSKEALETVKTVNTPKTYVKK